MSAYQAAKAKEKVLAEKMATQYPELPTAKSKAPQTQEETQKVQKTVIGAAKEIAEEQQAINMRGRMLDQKAQSRISAVNDESTSKKTYSGDPRRGSIMTEREYKEHMKSASLDWLKSASEVKEYEWRLDTSTPSVFGRADKSSIYCRLCFGDIRPGVAWKEHNVSEKHIRNRKKNASSHCRQSSLQALVSKGVKNGLLSDAVVPPEVHLFRIETVREFLVSGRPIVTIDDLRPYLERISKLPLTHSSHLIRDYLPLISDENLSVIKNLISGKRLVGIFDATPLKYNHHAFNIGFVNEKTQLQIINAALEMFQAGSPNEKVEKQLSSIIIRSVGQLSVSFLQFISWCLDGCATNLAAMQNIDQAGLLELEDGCVSQLVKCYSHTTDNSGAKYTVNKKSFKRLKGPEAQMFSEKLQALFSAPGSQSKALFKLDMGIYLRKVSAIRWWAKQEFDRDAFEMMFLPQVALPPAGDPVFQRQLTLADWVDKMMTTGISEEYI